jgi:multisubunit Na+/H+ antiporter MnhF subunit
MAKNVGGIDRIVRAVVGIGLIAWVMTSNSNFVTDYMVIIGLVGFVVLLTAVFSWCPAYFPFHINTKKSQ